MYDASNRKDIRRAEKSIAQIESDRINYLVGAMSIPQGRLWFWTFLEECHLFSDPFTGDALREAYIKGERNVGLKIFADIIRHCPDDYIQMAREANERSITNDVRANRDTDPRSAGERPDEDSDGGVEGSIDNSVDYDRAEG